MSVAADSGEEVPDKRERVARCTQQQAAAILIPNARGMGFVNKIASIGIDQRMALASIDRLARVVAARPATPRTDGSLSPTAENRSAAGAKRSLHASRR